MSAETRADETRADETRADETRADETRADETAAESPTGHAPRTERQAINYCPYCSEETLFPLEGGGWECRSCRRAFSVTFRGLASASDAHEEQP